MTNVLLKPNQGILRLVLHQDGKRTSIKDCFYHVPLQVLRPAYLDDSGMAYIYLLNPCGGVVGGDTYDISITVEAEAQAYITTPSATKLYSATHLPTRQKINFNLEKNALLAYMPEQTIPYADAAFDQRIEVHLAPGARVFLGDILAPGRVARGESFQYRSYDTRLLIKNDQGDILLEDHLRLQPKHQRLAELGMFEAYAYIASFYALGLDQTLSQHLTNDLQGALGDEPHLLGSATELAHGGLAVRILSQTHHHANQALHMVWDTVRQQVQGCPAVASQM